MQATSGLTPGAAVSNRLVSRHRPAPEAKQREGKATVNHAAGEINAYTAIRDGLLAIAEKVTTRGTLDSLSIANEFVENCLFAARSPYEAQSLPEADAARERNRCLAVRARIAALSAKLAVAL